MALAQGLAILQGLAQLQTAQVGKQASGFGAQSKWSSTVPGMALFVDATTGLARVNGAYPAGSNPGSAAQPFATLGDALDALASPATAAAWATPREIYIGPGTYTVGGRVISRSLTLICSAGTIITDQLEISADPGAANDHGSVADVQVGVVAPPSAVPVAVLGAGVDVSGSVHAVTLTLDGVNAGLVEVDAATPAVVALRNARAQVLASAAANNLSVVADYSRLDGNLRFANGLIRSSLISAAVVDGDGVKETRLYATRLAGGGTWTGGTLLIDDSTNFDFVADGWTKANPGGVAPTIMT